MKYFTIYWLGGTRSIIKGETIEQAFANAGYGAGAVRAVDWYDDKPSNTHYWDSVTKQWVRRTPIIFDVSDAETMNPAVIMEKVKELGGLMSMVERACENGVAVRFSNKDQLQIRTHYGDYATVGWLKVIEVNYAEYQKGSYCDDGEEDHHYMATGLQYFHPENTVDAINAFIDRVEGGRSIATPTGSQFDAIVGRQYRTGEWSAPL